MKIGFLSDCHCNLYGLKRAIELLKREKCEKLVCLGDIVGYGAMANETVDLVKSTCDVVIAGNHDRAVVESSYEQYNDYAVEAILYARAHLSKSNMSWLSSLPLYFEFEQDRLHFQLTHAHPQNWQSWAYRGASHHFNLEKTKTSLCLFGHTHSPAVSLSSRSEIPWTPKNFIDYSFLEYENETLILNPGSCGQPRDLDCRVSVCLVDTKNRTFRFLRGEYELGKTQESIISGGLNPLLANRLNLGK